MIPGDRHIINNIEYRFIAATNHLAIYAKRILPQSYYPNKTLVWINKQGTLKRFILTARFNNQCKFRRNNVYRIREIKPSIEPKQSVVLPFVAKRKRSTNKLRRNKHGKSANKKIRARI